MTGELLTAEPPAVKPAGDRRAEPPAVEPAGDSARYVWAAMASAPDPIAARPHLSVVVPAHNEAPYLRVAVEALVDGLRARGAIFEVLVVENGSLDGTWQVASSLAEGRPELRVLSLRQANYGAALRNGFRAARGELVANIDVDLVDMDFLDRALALAEADADLDVVIGTKRGAGAEDRRAPGRRAVTGAFSLLMKYGFGLQVSDTHGLKLLRADRMRPLVDACGLSGDLFDTELVLRAERAGMSVAEIPVVVAERRPPRTPIASRVPRTVAGLVRLRARLGPPPAAPIRKALPPAPPVPTQPRGLASTGVDAGTGMDAGTATAGTGRGEADEALRAGIERLVSTLEELAQRLAPLDDLSQRVEEPTRGIQLLDTLPEQVEGLATRLAALGDLPERLATLGEVPDRLGEVATRMEDLRTHLEQLAGAPALLDSLVSRTSRIEEALAGVSRHLASTVERLEGVSDDVGPLAAGVDRLGLAHDEQSGALTALRDEVRALRRRIPLRGRPQPALDEPTIAALADAVAARLATASPPRRRQAFKDQT